MNSDIHRTRRLWRGARRLAAATATGVLVAAGLLMSAGPSYAVSSTTCLGSSTITYSPGLTFTPRTVHYAETDSFSSCASTDPTLTSGGSFSGITIDGASCLGVPSIHEDPEFTITWNNGQHSVIDLTFTDTIAAGIEQVTGTGPVVSGQFQGGNATVIWLYVVPNPLQCLTSSGVTLQNGTLTAQITTL